MHTPQASHPRPDQGRNGLQAPGLNRAIGGASAHPGRVNRCELSPSSARALLVLPGSPLPRGPRDGLRLRWPRLTDCCGRGQPFAVTLLPDRSAITTAPPTRRRYHVISRRQRPALSDARRRTARAADVHRDNDNSDWIMLMSEIDRLTSLPVWISSWLAAVHRDRAPSISVPPSCWTLRDSFAVPA